MRFSTISILVVTHLGHKLVSAEPGGGVDGSQERRLGPPEVVTSIPDYFRGSVGDLAKFATEGISDKDKAFEIPRITHKPLIEPPPHKTTLDPLLFVQQEYDEGVRADTATVENLRTFPGITRLDAGPLTPPDPVGDVGSNHFVQMTNSQFGSAVLALDKTTGNRVAGPFPLRDIAVAAGSTLCQNTFGDPIVLYDQYASKWVLTEFFRNGLCVYISDSDDFMGPGWNVYAFRTVNFPDYPKYGVWHDAYYVGTNEAVPTVYAMERDQMLQGNPARMIQDTLPRLGGFPFQLAVPADADGSLLPPAGSPGIFVRHVDDESHYMQGYPLADFIEIWTYEVDWTVPTPTGTLMPGQLPIAVAEFSSELCGLSAFFCVPQRGTTTLLDPLREPIMHRPQYRNFGTHETMVLSWVTDVGDFPDHHGVRWAELRRDGGAWALHQEGTWAPDDNHRWMSSIAMDGSGNIALEYSISSSTIFPGIQFVARTASDPAGVMTSGEQLIMDGAGSQTFSTRYGDYSSISVDPIDDCTFWTTNEYIPRNGNWETKIASFRLASCGDISSKSAKSSKSSKSAKSAKNGKSSK